MEWFLLAAPWMAVAALALAALVLLRRQARALLAVLARTGIGLAALAAVNAVGSLVGVTLGVNLANALVLGVLGVPGFALLLMVNWMLQA